MTEVWSDLETYAQYYQSGIDSSFDFAFADKDGVIAKAVKGTSGASSYGKAIVRLQDALGTYSDSYIDAPFTPTMIWEGAQGITPAILWRRRPNWRRR